MLGECCLWRGLLAPFYSWGSRRPKSLGLSSLALGGHLQSWPALLPTAEQESARPDSPHHRQALDLPAILGNGTHKDDKGDGPEGKILHEVENRKITRPRSHSTSGHSKDRTSSWPPTFKFLPLYHQKVRAEPPGPWTSLAVPLPFGQGICGAKGMCPLETMPPF